MQHWNISTRSKKSLGIDPSIGSSKLCIVVTDWLSLPWGNAYARHNHGTMLSTRASLLKYLVNVLHEAARQLEFGNIDKKSMILIVDDYYGVLPTFREAFEDFPSLNWIHLLIRSKFRPNTYDLLIIDIRLPQLDTADWNRNLVHYDESHSINFSNCFVKGWSGYFNTVRNSFFRNWISQ